jgi:hypothetical protein
LAAVGHYATAAAPVEQYGGCELVIVAPDDSRIYDCFAQAVQRWSHLTSHEQLWLEHDIPITPAFRDPGIPRTLQHLFESAPLIISRIEVQIAGVLIRYARSGHAPFRESCFDSLHVTAWGDPGMTCEELRNLLASFCNRLPVVMARGSALFARLAAELTCFDALRTGSRAPRHLQS